MSAQQTTQRLELLCTCRAAPGRRTVVLLLVHAKVAAAVLHQGARLTEAAGVKQHLRAE